MARATAAEAQAQLKEVTAAQQSREAQAREMEVRLSGVVAAKAKAETEMVQRQAVRTLRPTT